MRLTIRFLGLDLLDVEIATDEQQGDGLGECTTYPVGFVQSPGDQRWESAPELP